MFGRLLKSFLGSPENTLLQLREQHIPVADDPCRACANPCEQGHAEMPKLFIDTTFALLGSVKPLRRHVLVSTGKTDWSRKVEHESGTLACLLTAADSRLSDWKPRATDKTQVSGVFTDQDSAYLSILNSSHTSVADKSDSDSILVFPDYKVAIRVERTPTEAEELWRHALNPAFGRVGRYSSQETELRSYVLPYAAVVMVCSHKRRDNRCGQTAPLLIEAFKHELTIAGWHVHEDLEHVDFHDEQSSLEALHAIGEDHVEQTMQTQLRQAGDSKAVLILSVSHTGGHKYAGVMQIYLPQGTGIFYGRVSTHEIPAIVQSTIIQGKVLPELCRGVMNGSREHSQTLLNW
ncbi:Sucraseferredoxin-like protein, partial [Auriculariales sp. MPI-PUGE-AT-0066]